MMFDEFMRKMMGGQEGEKKKVKIAQMTPEEKEKIVALGARNKIAMANIEKLEEQIARIKSRMEFEKRKAWFDLQEKYDFWGGEFDINEETGEIFKTE